MAEQTNTQELDTPEETLTTPETSTPEAPADSGSSGESNSASDTEVKGKGEQAEATTANPSSNSDKADWKWKAMRKSLKSSNKELKRKTAEIESLRKQLEELKANNQQASGMDLIRGINKEGRLEERIEALEEEDKQTVNTQKQEHLTKLAAGCFSGEELAKYNAEIAPRVQATLEDLNSISPIVTRYIATSKNLPRFMNEIADMVKSGEDVKAYIENIESQSYNVYTGKMDPQIAFELCREWEKELVARSQAAPAAPAPAPQEAPKPKAPSTGSVNSPASSSNDGYDLEAVRRYRGC